MDVPILSLPPELDLRVSEDPSLASAPTPWNKMGQEAPPEPHPSLLHTAPGSLQTPLPTPGCSCSAPPRFCPGPRCRAALPGVPAALAQQHWAMDSITASSGGRNEWLQRDSQHQTPAKPGQQLPAARNLPGPPAWFGTDFKGFRHSSGLHLKALHSRVFTPLKRQHNSCSTRGRAGPEGSSAP